MRFHLTPRPLLHLITAILLAPQPTVFAGPLGAISLNDLFARDYCAGGTWCGYSSQLCCSAGSTCYTDTNDQAQCGAAGATAAVAGESGYWAYQTVVSTMTDFVATTVTLSSYVAATVVAATPTAGTCNYALNETPCGSCCCASNEYCYTAGTCSPAAVVGSSGYYTSYTTPTPTPTPGAPIRGGTTSVVIVTASGTTYSASYTTAFLPAVETGANLTITSNQVANHGLSGGAIAGIVIGVLLGLFLLGLLCFYCCIKGLLDGFLALFGLGGRRRRTTEVEEYERRSHHSSGGRANRRTWYGASRPARVSRYEERDRRQSNWGGEALGIAGGLAALWAILGLKRRRTERRRRDDEKYSEYSYDSAYYSGTSESSASTNVRRDDVRREVREVRRSSSRRP